MGEIREVVMEDASSIAEISKIVSLMIPMDNR